MFGVVAGKEEEESLLPSSAECGLICEENKARSCPQSQIVVCLEYELRKEGKALRPLKRPFRENFFDIKDIHFRGAEGSPNSPMLSYNDPEASSKSLILS